uniref:Predicted protein n=1 Tax=Hordeum vulgare subsp. vulgare TaxID=112509 RepID=F2E551_HORVV|nr:predicted protein [Hordeum vulgare subsp. vulgare]
MRLQNVHGPVQCYHCYRCQSQKGDKSSLGFVLVLPVP